MTFRIVVRNRRSDLLDEFEAASEKEAREVAQAQSTCDGQRSLKFYVYDGPRKVAVYRNGVEGATKRGHRRPKPPSPIIEGGKTYSVGIYTATGVHTDTVPMPSESEALTFAVTKWRHVGFRTFEFRVYIAYDGGQRHLAGRFRRGRRLKQ